MVGFSHVSICAWLRRDWNYSSLISHVQVASSSLFSSTEAGVGRGSGRDADPSSIPTNKDSNKVMRPAEYVMLGPFFKVKKWNF